MNKFGSKGYIKVKNATEARSIREKVVNFLWKGEGLPSGAPHLKPGIHSGVKLRLGRMNGISCGAVGEHDGHVCTPKVHAFEYKMSHGINSLMYLCVPAKKRNNKLVIYHHGHHSNMTSFDFGERTMGFFLSKGYHVMSMSMPLTWPNNRRMIVDRTHPLSANLDGVQFGADTSAHNALGRLETSELCPVKFLIEPVHAALNLLDAEYGFDSYNMVGISGGGWTTTLCAAIDDRISQSYSVAGSIPIELRDQSSVGDYEQRHPTLYSIANYLDLYILGAFGTNRKCVHVYNENDPCCFAGREYERYDSIVRKTSNDLGGYYKVYLDENNTRHSISQWSLDRIEREMRN